jgi:hypothetical protein
MGDAEKRGVGTAAETASKGTPAEASTSTVVPGVVVRIQ